MYQGIEGLTALTVDQDLTRMTGSKFALPPTFPTQSLASKWVVDGMEVIEAGQPQVLSHANCQAQGWTPFMVVDIEATKAQPVPKQIAGKDPVAVPAPVMTPFSRVIGGKKYVLLFRPKALQRAINNIYADQSRSLVNRDLLGENTPEEGLITNAELRKHDRMEGDAPSAIPRGRHTVHRPEDDNTLQLQ